MRLIVTMLTVVLALATTVQAQPSKPNGSVDDLTPEQLALGRELAVVMTPNQVNGASSVERALSDLSDHGFDGKWIMIFPEGQKSAAANGIDVDVEPIRHSLEVGAARIAPQLLDALGRIYAHAFDAQTLHASIDFYGSVEEKAVLARRDEALRQLSLLLPQAGQSGEDSLARSRLVLDQVHQAEALTPAERAFAATGAGVALASRAKETRREIGAALLSLWPQADTVAETDYCTERICDAGVHWSFHRLAVFFGPEIERANLVDTRGLPMNDGAAQSLYDHRSSEGRGLQDFDRTHAACEMWTDWRKLCSRMGPNGATTCRTDPLHSAEPSEPFCAAGDHYMADDTTAQRSSRDRYCVRYYTFSPHPDGQLETKGVPVCVEYRSDRPFSGELIAQVETPDCLQWSDICATDTVGAANGLPSCGDAKVRKQRQRWAFACTRWSAPLYCSDPIGVSHLEESVVSLLIGHPLSSRPVWGVYCQTGSE